MTLEEQSTRLQSLQDRLRSFCEKRSPFLLVFVPLALIYIATASYGLGYHIDPFTSAVTGWHIGMTGSVLLPDYEEAAEPEQFGNIAWIVESPRGPVSQYPPGAAALSAPLYRIWDQPLSPAVIGGFNNPDAEPIPLGFPSLTPATLTAALASAAAMGFLAATIPFVGGSRYQAVITGYVGGLATTMWAVASDALWQHGPASMWIALAILLVARSHLEWAGLAFGAFVRQPVDRVVRADQRRDVALVRNLVGVAIAARPVRQVDRVHGGVAVAVLLERRQRINDAEPVDVERIGSAAGLIQVGVQEQVGPELVHAPGRMGLQHARGRAGK